MKLVRNLVLSAAALALLNFTGCKQQENNAKPVDKLAYNDTVAVNVIKVSKESISLNKTFSGTVEGYEQANITSKMPERIVNLNIKVGDYVNKGQVVITLDRTGSSQFYQAQAALRNAEKDLARYKALLDAGAVSQQVYDQIELNYTVSKANLDASQSAINITSPISGVVTNVNIVEGDLAAPGIVLATVANISRLKSVFNVSEADIANIKNGQSVEIYSEQKADAKLRGTVDEITRSANVQSRSFEVKAVFSNTGDKFFKPGMFSRVNVDLKNQLTLAVPTEAVMFEGNKSFVFVINDGRATKREIKTGTAGDKFTEVLSGINEGDTIVTLGMNNLKEGAVVYIANK